MPASQPNIKEMLNGTLRSVCSDIDKYAENPGVDFTRDRKLPAFTLIQFMLNMEGGSISRELFNNFPIKKERMSASAYEQQRDKLKPDAFKAVLKAFNDTFESPDKFKGLRVYAIDGSDFCTPLNKESDWYIPNHYIRKDGQEAKGTCLMHGNFLYDILNKQYMDVVETRDERAGAIALMDGIDNAEGSLVIMDRGYSGYNMIEHGNRFGGYYVIRNPLSNTIKEINEMPDEPCDIDLEIRVSTKSQQFCDIYNYRKLNVRKNKKAAEDYSDLSTPTQWDFEEKCVVKFRAVKFRINDPDTGRQEWEVLVTNLPRDKFPLESMKKIYHLRWGIETSFRELKYAIGAINFHSKKDKFIRQELLVHLIMYNAASRIALAIPIKNSESGWVYAVDFTIVLRKIIVPGIGNKIPHFQKGKSPKSERDML